MRLNLFLLKPSRFKVLGDSAAGGQLLCVSRGNERWMSYEPRISEPLLQFLPTILARWIVENLFDDLNLEVPPRPRASDTVYTDHAGRKWTTMSLNVVLQRVIEQAADGTHLAVFGAIEHESELFEGTPRIRSRSSFRGQPRHVSEQILFHCYSTFILLLLHPCLSLFQAVSGLLCHNSPTSILPRGSLQIPHPKRHGRCHVRSTDFVLQRCIQASQLRR